MKLRIDTDNKTITIDESVLLNTLIETLDGMFPDKQWKSFTLIITSVIYDWTSPIIIKRYPTYPTYPSYPWIVYISAGDTTAAGLTTNCNVSYGSGSYDIEIK